MQQRLAAPLPINLEDVGQGEGNLPVNRSLWWTSTFTWNS